MKRVLVYVTPKKGILDPAGQATQRALQSLGYQGVEEVRIGKYIQLTIRDNDFSESSIKEMCGRLLANPVIEDYHYEVSDV